MKSPDASSETDRPAGRTQSPLVVATIGLHGSASTWVFNVARELLITSFGEEKVLSCYAEEISQLPDETSRYGRHLVIKSHHGSAELDEWLCTVRAFIILSIRDPRDASISMTNRFKAPLSSTTGWVLNDCNRLLGQLSKANLLLRYEDRFFESPSTIVRLAHVLQIEPKPDNVAVIFERYRTEVVRHFADSLKTLPPERLIQIGTFTMDRVTQILAPHIGDAKSEKWRELPNSVQKSMTKIFETFLKRMEYPAD